MTHRPNPDVPAVDWPFQPAQRVEGSVYIEMWKIKRGDAVPARATRSPTRAVFHRLGHAAGIAIAAMGLAGCSSGDVSQQPSVATQQASAVLLSTTFLDVKKFCDEGRAVYFAEGGYKAGLAIVENAKECSTEKKQ